jgi:hypothetical protein
MRIQAQEEGFGSWQRLVPTSNAPKLNNAWWRWFESGPRNTPVTIRLHGSAKVHRPGILNAD